jgi:AraC-like DNA-binding protein
MSDIQESHTMSFLFEEVQRLNTSFVDTIWRVHHDGTGTFVSKATSRWEIVVTKHQGKMTLTVRGPETKATPVNYSWTEAEMVGMTFQPGTYMPHLPPGKVRDLHDSILPEATRNSFWLHGSAWQYPDYEHADLFVDQLIHNGLLKRDPVVDALLQGHPQELSLRSLQYRFVHVTGLTHRTLLHIERARLAARLLEQGMPILDVVFEAGYFDQPHLSRSLKSLLGQTPAQIREHSCPLQTFAF